METCPYCGSGDIEYLGIDDGGGDFGKANRDVYLCHDCRSWFGRYLGAALADHVEDDLDVQ